MQPPQDLPFPPPPPPRRGAPWALIAIFGCGCSLIAIVILVAILFPVFSAAREAARTTSCVSNQKKLALGILMYSQDYDEKFPAAVEWTSLVGPYVIDMGALRCPSFEPRGASVFGYAFNAAVSRKVASAIPSPETTPLIFDSTKPEPNASDPVQSLPVPGRHRRGNVIGFVDGSVRRIPDSGASESDTGY